MVSAIAGNNKNAPRSTSHDTPDIGVGKPMNSSQKLQAGGRESRQKAIDRILELLTGDAVSAAQMRESAMALVYFEPKILAEIDRIGRSYDEAKERSFSRYWCAGFRQFERHKV
jgi:hypothetical protein